MQTAPYDPLDIRDSLHDLVAADPVIDAISVIERDQVGQLRVFTSTSTEEREELLSLAGRAITTQSDASDRSSTLMLFALPVPGRGNYAVAVTVGLESLLQARSHELRVAFGFAIPTIVLVTLLVHLMVRQLVDRIDQATRDLSLRNTQLAASQNAMLALRESLSHTERVAALGQVAANVAHQAGTPLNLVSGYVQMIRDDPRTDERTRARLVTVDAQIQQVTRVLRTMLDRARQPSGLAIVALAHVIERVRELAQPRLSRANIQLKLSVDSDRRWSRPTRRNSRWRCSTSSPTPSTRCPTAVRCRSPRGHVPTALVWRSGYGRRHCRLDQRSPDAYRRRRLSTQAGRADGHRQSDRPRQHVQAFHDLFQSQARVRSAGLQACVTAGLKARTTSI